MKRHPIPSGLVPACHRIEEAESEMCDNCSSTTTCVEPKFAPKFSIAERAAQLRLETETGDLGESTDSISTLYEDEHQRIFGTRPRNWQTAQTDVMLGRLLSQLLRDDISPALWITAQMQQLKQWVQQNSRIGFLPRMLCGEKAMGRYNAYIRAAKRRTHFASKKALDNRTQLSQIRAEVMSIELDIAQLYIEANLFGPKAVSWAAVVDFVPTSPNWKALSTLNGTEYLELRRKHGREWVLREAELMHVEAAIPVLARYSVELPHRVGYSKFSWSALLDIVRGFVEDTTGGVMRRGIRKQIY